MSALDRTGSPAAGIGQDCRPWFALVEETLCEAALPAWDSVALVLQQVPRPGAPLLAGAAVSLDRQLVLGMKRRLLGALQAGTTHLASVGRALDDEDGAFRLFDAALADDRTTVDSLAARRAADPDALQAVASLLPVPLLQACHRRLSPGIDPAWSHGYCPLCGSWPAFAEVLGIERSRRSRCGRCGAAWPATLLTCAFCGTTDHRDFAHLVPAAAGPADEPDRHRRGAVEACTRCGGYLKAFTVLEACPPLNVMLRDLETVDLDLAAIDNGHARPARPGYRLDLRSSAS